MADYVRSDQPTIVVAQTSLYETLQITVTNPTPTGSRPTVLSNQVWRKVHGSANGWTLVGTTGNNGSIYDFFLRANTQYDYFARTDTNADSTAVLGTTPSIMGFWLCDAANQFATLRHFPYGSAGGEMIGVEETALRFVGRTYPVMETGVEETQVVVLQPVIPFSDPDWLDQIEWWRLRKRGRSTLLLRDSRGHAYAGYITGDLAVTPSDLGAQITASFQRVDYVAATTTITDPYYTGGLNNDGGFGLYGLGIQGLGY